MEPENVIERKQAKRKFLGLFLLAMIPLMAAVFFFTKMDSTEKTALRSAIESQKSTTQTSEEVESQILKLETRLGTYSDEWSKLKGGALGPSKAAELSSEFRKLEETLNDLNGMELSPDVEALSNMMAEVLLVFENSQTVYDEVLKEYNANSDELDKAQSELLEYLD